MVLVDQFCSKVQKDISPIPTHLFYPQKVNRYTGNVQRPSMTYPLSVINVDLNSALNRASTDKDTR
jgi:hypothetical protein